MSAFGGLIADIKNDFIYCLSRSNSASVDEIKDGLGALAREAMSWIREDQGFEGEVLMVPSVDMRYRAIHEIDTTI